jgi:putative membrane protein
MEKSNTERKLNRAASIISVVVLLLVISMRRIPRLDFGIDFSFLPAVYSVMNTLSAVFLLFGLYFIKNKQVEKHRKMMFTALTSSFLFLLMYVLYHITTPEIKYCGEGSIRYFYFLLLITHIVLAAVSFPFILFTFIRGYLMQVERHKQMARWVYWLWLYVAITGPVVYLMLRPCINS